MEGSSFFQRLKRGLTKNRETWVQKIGAIFQNRRWDETSLDEMEESLIAADVGVNATQKVMETLRRQAPSGSEDAGQEMSSRLTRRSREHASGLEPRARGANRSRSNPGSSFFSASTASVKQRPSASSRRSTATPGRRSSSLPATPFVRPQSNNSMSGASVPESTSSNIARAQTHRRWFSTACKPPKAAAWTFC